MTNSSIWRKCEVCKVANVKAPYQTCYKCNNPHECKTCGEPARNKNDNCYKCYKKELDASDRTCIDCDKKIIGSPLKLYCATCKSSRKLTRWAESMAD